MHQEQSIAGLKRSEPAVLHFAAHLLRFEPASSGGHSHQDVWQVEYVATGHVRCEVGGAEYLLKAGSFIAIPPGYSHRQDVPRGTDSYMLRFALSHSHSTDAPVVLHLAADDAAAALDIVKALVYEHDGRAAGRETLINALLTQLMVWMGRWQSVPGTGTPLGVSDDAEERTRRVADVLRRRYAERFSTNQLAEMACLSRSRFMELFRQQFGAPPHAFQRSVQMQKAVELAQHTGMSWQQIALHLGYKDASHFSRAFKMVMGCPPSRFTPRDEATE